MYSYLSSSLKLSDSVRGLDGPFTVCHFLLEYGNFTQVRNEPRSEKRDLLAIKSEIFTEKEIPSCCEHLQKI